MTSNQKKFHENRISLTKYIYLYSKFIKCLFIVEIIIKKSEIIEFDLTNTKKEEENGILS